MSSIPANANGDANAAAIVEPYRSTPSAGGDDESSDDEAASTRSNYDSTEDEDERDGNVAGDVDSTFGDGGVDDDDGGGEDDEEELKLAQMAEEVGGIDLADGGGGDDKSDESIGRSEGGDDDDDVDDDKDNEELEILVDGEEEAEEDQQRRIRDDVPLSYELHEFDNTPTLATVARWIHTGKCRRILILSGAGVSCSAGIPDFRTPGTGLYDNLARYNLPYPEAVFDLNFYRRNPGPFVSLASEIWPGTRHSPTLTHSFVTLLDRRGLLLRNFTQNIDGLEVLAGVSEERIVECHGHFRTASCVNCSTPFDGDKCRDEILTNRRAPECRRCHGPVKPDIVFFGEGLPDRFGRLLRRDLDDADLLIVMGTSLTVAPVSLIPEMIDEDVPRLLMNRELVGDFDAGGGSSCRDIFAEGDCDDTSLELCRMMGWEEELRELNEAARIFAGPDSDDG